jgi:uncharacterized protein YraI
MFRSAILTAALLLSALVAGPAFAATVNAVTTASVNLRAGPGTHYPIVTVLPDYADVAIHGCLADYSWCDISWSRERGWVSAHYLSVSYPGGPVIVSPIIAPRIGVTVVVFNQNYWRRHYVGRPWYGRWSSYGPVTSSRSVTCEPGQCSGSRTITGPRRTVTGGSTVTW